MEILKPTTTCRMVAFDKFGRLLLAKRPKTSKSRGGEIDFIGGKVDPGETVQNGLIREVKEELGLCLDPRELEDLTTVRDNDKGAQFIRKYLIYHLPVEVNQVTQLPEHDLLIFVQPATALQLVTFMPHRQAILSAESSSYELARVA